MGYVGLLTITLLAGYIAAWAWTRCIGAVTNGKPLEAAFYDAIIVLSSTAVTLTIWAAVANDPLVFVCWAVGNAVGTYWTVKHK